ncbi:MAG: hypothetical protein AAF497_08235 [Planctomycetota bacterium]
MNEPREKSWWRLHWLTWIVVAVISAIQSCVMIPGHPSVVFRTYLTQIGSNGRAVTYQHGWPFVYYKSVRIEAYPKVVYGPNRVRRRVPQVPKQLTSEEMNGAYLDSSNVRAAIDQNNPKWDRMEPASTYTWASGIQPTDAVAPWRKSESWRHMGFVSRWDIVALLLNAVIFIAIVGFIAWTVEGRIRNGLAISQFNLAQLIIITTVCALFAAWVASEIRARRLSETIANCAVPIRVTTSTANTPVWIARLWGLKNCTWFNRVSTISVGEPMWVDQEQPDLDELADWVRAYGRLTDFSVEKDGTKVERFVRRAGRLSSVRVWETNPDEAKWRAMAEVGRWGELQFMQ